MKIFSHRLPQPRACARIDCIAGTVLHRYCQRTALSHIVPSNTRWWTIETWNHRLRRYSSRNWKWLAFGHLLKRSTSIERQVLTNNIPVCDLVPAVEMDTADDVTALTFPRSLHTLAAVAPCHARYGRPRIYNSEWLIRIYVEFSFGYVYLKVRIKKE